MLGISVLHNSIPKEQILYPNLNILDVLGYWPLQWRISGWNGCVMGSSHVQLVEILKQRHKNHTN